jgi:hypothetical protein
MSEIRRLLEGARIDPAPIGPDTTRALGAVVEDAA